MEGSERKGWKKCAACARLMRHTTGNYRVIAAAGPRPRIFWAARCRECESSERAIPAPPNLLAGMAR